MNPVTKARMLALVNALESAGFVQDPLYNPGPNHPQRKASFVNKHRRLFIAIYELDVPSEVDLVTTTPRYSNILLSVTTASLSKEQLGIIRGLGSK